MNIAIIGNSGVGKTTYIKRLVTGEFEQLYKITYGCEITSHKFEYNQIFNIYDVSGHESYSSKKFRNKIYKDIDIFFIMFDVTSVLSFNNAIRYWRNEVKDYGKPILLLANKVDIKEVKINSKHLNKVKHMFTKYIQISSKSCWNYNIPFRFLNSKI